MAPNGLIFLLVVAIWGAYFVQHWIRRREHLSTARSMDRFSESLRVLARHGAATESVTGGSESASSDPVRPRTSSYAAHLAGRPAAMADMPVATADVSVAKAKVPATDGWDWDPATDPKPALTPAESAPEGVPATMAEELEPAHRVEGRGLRVPRAVRGLVLLAQLVLVPVLAVVALLTALTWVAPAVASLALVAALVWVRASARAEAAERAALARDIHDRPTRRTWSTHESTAEAPMPASRRRPSAPDLAVDVEEPGRGEAVAEHSLRCDAPFDIDPPAPARPARPAAARQLIVDEDDIPLTWDPRPVPRPTYALKGYVDRSTAYDELALPGAQVPYDEEQNTRRAVGG